MGPLFAFLFCAVIAGVFGALWFGFRAVFVAGRRRHSRLLKWLGGVPLAGLTLIGLLVVGFVAFALARRCDPNFLYREAFHERPTADVTGLQSETGGFASDSAEKFMRFHASRETFQRILPKTIRKASYQQYCDLIRSDDARLPTWWSPPTGSTTDIYLLRSEWGKGERFSGEDTVMTYDTTTGTVQYYYLGID